jgi:sugar (pentulose or hexulose) kinase
VASEVWSEQTWSDRIPNVLVGFEPGHERSDVARAFIEAHAYAIRANLEDLERAAGSPFVEVLLLGGAGRDRAFAQLVTDVLERPLRRPDGAYPPGTAFAWLARRAQGGSAEPPTAAGDVLEPATGDEYGDGYRRFLEMDDVIRHGLGMAA